MSFKADRHGSGVHQWEVEENDLIEYAKVSPTCLPRYGLSKRADRIYLADRLRPSNLHHQIVNPAPIPPGVHAGNQKQNVLLHPPAHLGKPALLPGGDVGQDLPMFAQSEGLGQEYPGPLSGGRCSNLGRCCDKRRVGLFDTAFADCIGLAVAYEDDDEVGCVCDFLGWVVVSPSAQIGVGRSNQSQQWVHLQRGETAD